MSTLEKRISALEDSHPDRAALRFIVVEYVPRSDGSRRPVSAEDGGGNWWRRDDETDDAFLSRVQADASLRGGLVLLGNAIELAL